MQAVLRAPANNPLAFRRNVFISSQANNNCGVMLGAESIAFLLPIKLYTSFNNQLPTNKSAVFR